MAIDRGRCGKEIHESRSIVSQYQMFEGSRLWKRESDLGEEEQGDGN
jgi:hypothetical protein